MQCSVFPHLLHPSWHILKKYPCCWCWFDLCENSGTGKSESKIHSLKDCVGHTRHVSSSLKHNKTKTSLKQVSSLWQDTLNVDLCAETWAKKRKRACAQMMSILTAHCGTHYTKQSWREHKNIFFKNRKQNIKKMNHSSCCFSVDFRCSC